MMTMIIIMMILIIMIIMIVVMVMVIIKDRNTASHVLFPQHLCLLIFTFHKKTKILLAITVIKSGQ